MSSQVSRHGPLLLRIGHVLHMTRASH